MIISMKKLVLLLLVFVTVSLTAIAQSPEGFKYQAVVRNASNVILANQAVGLRMIIEQGSIEEQVCIPKPSPLPRMRMVW